MIFANTFKKFLGSRNERILKRLQKIVEQINALEASTGKLSEQQLKAKTAEFRKQLQAGDTTLDKILPEAFALVREAAQRALNMRHFDVQLIGGMVLHSGKIAEMRTGEGKTLVATLPAYLNALTGVGVHIVTINDYLAKRDAHWMGPVYEALGLTVSYIVHGMSREEKQLAYKQDIIYGTNNEFGFDYLRDNMAFSAVDRMQGPLKYAIVDEVDSILIDEARTPLIISGADQDSSELYIKINAVIKHLRLQQEKDGPGDFSIDEKNKNVYLTEAGHEQVENLLTDQGLLASGASLYDARNIGLVHHVYAALRANYLFKRDVDYIVKDNQVVIVDEHTGRTMPGRRWSEGLHQAVEAKERVPIQSESQTLASITFQNYFRLYDKLAGMTGTADTEAYEFQQIYGLEVVVIPTNKPNRREDLPDLVYLTQEEKFNEIIKNIESCVTCKQPVLVGTISIETSEYLSRLLQQRKIEHRVLNAKFHEQEAQIIAEAGRPGKVTIATNMAGRGTDIVLGGNLEAEIAHLKAEYLNRLHAETKTTENTLAELAATGLEAELAADIERSSNNWRQRNQEVIAAGGLHIIGTERHESRRIDNQLRGRSGRQGDPGSTRFYLSVRDNLMRIFISEKISQFLNKLGMQKGEAITHPWITKAIENAQRKVEGHNFDIRKQLLEFDDVANDQRKVIYQQRNELMEINDVSAIISAITSEVIAELFAEYVPLQSIEEQWDIKGLTAALAHDFGQKLDIQQWLDADRHLHEETLLQRIQKHFSDLLQAKEAKIGFANMRYLEKTIMLNILDSHWKEHLATMDYMRQSIHLRGYAQKDPKQEYKREAFNLFKAMLTSIRREVIATLAMVQVQVDTDVEAVDAQLRDQREAQRLEFQHAQLAPLAVLQQQLGQQSQEDTTMAAGFGVEAGSLGGVSSGKAKHDAAARRQPHVHGPECQHEHEHSYAESHGHGGDQIPYTRLQPKVGRNEPCPCGSGKKYKQCHGKLGG